MNKAGGLVWIHSASAVLCPHIEWALSAALGTVVRLDWLEQPAQDGTYRAEYFWTGPPGMGAQLASALRGCQRARFEVTEDARVGAEGMRWSYTPTLGVHRVIIGVQGDVLIGEQRLRAALAVEGRDQRLLAAAVGELLGLPWDAELEPYRQASDGASVRWLHRVG